MDRRTHIAAQSGDIDDRDMRVGAAELVEKGGVVSHCADQHHPCIAFECSFGARDELRLWLHDQDADRADRINHRAIPKDCTR